MSGKSLKAIIFFVAVFFIFTSCETQKVKNPNIIFIYADDLGYADVGCYGAVGVKTPNIDKLAGNGLRFTDAHSSAATCTPSRYSLLTGQYAFRNKATILPGDAPLLIDTTRSTIASMLKRAGYTTGVVGKWHLGLGDGGVNWNERVSPGPKEIGFDYSFLLPATGDRVPCVYMENQLVAGLEKDDPITVSYSGKIGEDDDGICCPEKTKVQADRQHSESIIDSVSRIGYMTGGMKARWKDEDMADVLTGKAIDFIETNSEDPFFLFFSYHDIHVPRIPHKRFKGTSEMGPRGDAIVQMDWCTGEIVRILEELGIDNNTLIIFSSDNGPVLNDGYEDQSVELIGDHNPSGPFRGGKYSAYEAGTRVPTITYWPGVIQEGESDGLFSQVDLYASLAKMVDIPLGEMEAEDSENLLDLLLGKSEIGREIMLEESFNLGLRKDNWKYISKSKYDQNFISKKGIESGAKKIPQLYDLSLDIGEKKNLYKEHQDIAEEMEKLIKEIKE